MAFLMTVPLASGSLVDIDATLFIQLGIFLVMLVLLKFLLFNPVIRVIEARRVATTDTMKAAADLQAEATALRKDFDAKLETVRTEAAAERAEAVSRAKETERQLLLDAKERAEELTTEMRSAAAAEMQVARQQLETDIRETASLAVEKILDRKL